MFSCANRCQSESNKRTEITRFLRTFNLNRSWFDAGPRKQAYVPCRTKTIRRDDITNVFLQSAVGSSVTQRKRQFIDQGRPRAAWHVACASNEMNGTTFIPEMKEMEAEVAFSGARCNGLLM